MSDYSSSTSAQMRRGFQSSRHSIERGIEDYPLAMGAAAMAVGMLAGLCLPRTRAEDRLMGEQSDELKHRARQAGQQIVESGKQVAQAGADAAAGEAEPGSIAEKVKHVAQDVKQAAKESARREGLDSSTLKQKGRDVAERATEAARDEAKRQKRDLKS
jgi:gas vesicle protein